MIQYYSTMSHNNLNNMTIIYIISNFNNYTIVILFADFTVFSLEILTHANAESTKCQRSAQAIIKQEKLL